MSTDQTNPETDETTDAQGAADTAAPGAGPVGESAPEGAVAADDQAGAEAAEAAPEPEVVDPLEGKTDAEIRQLAAQGAEYLSLAQRTRADFDNYRKRMQRDVAAAKVRGGTDLARELLPAIDNVERALEHEGTALTEAGDASEAAQRILAALQSTHAEIVAALGRGGIERFDPLGEAFDPNRHEAVAQRPAEGQEAVAICGVVFQPGYAAGDEIIRAARVVVTN
ncbi:MAG: nucleotide exchange factor GrpE [Solirubrobacteraceae bacterium]|nr:nucleotide exchange factor GrpE [Solirubrobacteraceae bacterium]